MTDRSNAARRIPHDEKTPEETVDWVVQDWGQRRFFGEEQPPLAEAILDALVYKAFFEEAEGALRWLDPAEMEPSVMDRIGIIDPARSAGEGI